MNMILDAIWHIVPVFCFVSNYLSTNNMAKHLQTDIDLHSFEWWYSLLHGQVVCSSTPIRSMIERIKFCFATRHSAKKPARNFLLTRRRYTDVWGHVIPCATLFLSPCGLKYDQSDCTDCWPVTWHAGLEWDLFTRRYTVQHVQLRQRLAYSLTYIIKSNQIHELLVSTVGLHFALNDIL